MSEYTANLALQGKTMDKAKAYDPYNSAIAIDDELPPIECTELTDLSALGYDIPTVD